MPKHIFLTGPKQIGKSTIIRSYLSAHPVSCAGFLTIKSETVFPRARSVHMLNMQKNKKPSKENFLFFCGQTPDAFYDQYELSADPAPRFNQIGCALLDPIPSNSDLIIMDEIGSHESEADAFCNSILQRLNGNIPILGVLQQTDTDLFRIIAGHPDTKLIVITKENRDQIAEILGDLIPLQKGTLHIT